MDTTDKAASADQCLPLPRIGETASLALDSAVRSAADGFIVIDSGGHVEFLNQAAERLTGITAAAAVGLPLAHVLPLEESDGRAVHGDLVELAVVSDAPISLGTDLAMVGRDGHRYHVEGEIALCRDGEGATHAVLTVRDVTLRYAEEQRRHEEARMRTVAQLAGTVAHELNNLVTIILGHAEAVADRSADRPDVQESTTSIERAGRDIAKVTRQLLTLSHRQVLRPTAVELDSLVLTALPKFKELIPEGVDLTVSTQAGGSSVLLDHAQMEQALLDLVTHSRDRVGPAGRIVITTRRLLLDEGRRGRYLRRFAELTIADTGPSLRGIPVETLFEPSWTQAPGRPAGLSLFALRTLLGSARGHLTVENESETGAQFIIRLPEMEEEIMPAQTTKSEDAKPTILLVEDDDHVRVLLHNSLKKRGHQVIEARDGEEALMQADFHEGTIDLLISDVVMPRTNGVTLARELVRRRPETKLLLISGCPDDVADIQDLVKIGAHYVQKPFSQRDLVARAEAILSGNKPEAQGA